MGIVKVSAVIPIYNGEKYLSVCLDSVVNQTLEDIEIICVNDGSIDSSLEILEEYAKRDDRIKIISQKNSGLGAARNTGMKYATGKYISFVDSDDWIDNNAYEYLYNGSIVNDLDVMFFPYSEYYEDSKEFVNTNYSNMERFNSKFDDKIFNHEDLGKELFFVCLESTAKFYKRKFLENFHIQFPEGKVFEDVPFFFEVFLNAKKIAILRKHLYFYRKHGNSIMGSGDSRFYDGIYINNLVIDIFLRNKMYDSYKYELLNFKIAQSIFHYTKIDEKYKKNFFHLLKEDFEEMKSKLMKNINLDKLESRCEHFYLNILKANSIKEFTLLNDLEKLQSDNNQINSQNKNILKKINKNKKIIEKVLNSNSWRMGSAFRNLMNFFR